MSGCALLDSLSNDAMEEFAENRRHLEGHGAGDDHEIRLARPGRKTSAPNRAISKREVDDAIISMAQQASPKVMGQMADLRAQLNT